MGKIILGCGTGRCGSTSLARLFENCKNTHISHYCPITRKVVRAGVNVMFDSKYIISISPHDLGRIEKLIEKNGDVRMVCLRRNRKETTESFMRVGSNLSETELEEYWNDYYNEAERLRGLYPQHVRIFDTDILNSREGQKEIFDFVGISEQDRGYLDDCCINCYINKSEI